MDAEHAAADQERVRLTGQTRLESKWLPADRNADGRVRAGEKVVTEDEAPFGGEVEGERVVVTIELGIDDFDVLALDKVEGNGLIFDAGGFSATHRRQLATHNAAHGEPLGGCFPRMTLLPILAPTRRNSSPFEHDGVGR